MRLNKFISETGFCSRREADELITQQRVTLNGEIAGTGAKWLEGMTVCIDGEEIKLKATIKNKRKHVYIALNKPVGITCTTDQNIKGNIIDFVDHQERIFPIGRLDKDSEGLILLTSNGNIVNQILRSENEHEKEYLVGVNKAVNDDFLRIMARGVRIHHNQLTKPCKVSRLAKYGFRITLTQGLNRQIRLMSEALGYKVTQLRRIRIINVQLGTLKPGTWRNLTDKELAGLLPDFKDW
jgi:23S rRNA pseudouridine2604 synthase